MAADDQVAGEAIFAILLSALDLLRGLVLDQSSAAGRIIDTVSDGALQPGARPPEQNHGAEKKAQG